MNLNPEDRKNWHGFLDLMQPPPGYRLGAAIGTTFGLSIEALVAGLLSMCNADGEELLQDPVAATIAITKLSDKVRVLVQAGTISCPAPNAGTNPFVALLDRLLVQIKPSEGLFHPKVWAIRFEHIGTPKDGVPGEVWRVFVGSRNLGRSTSFELGAVFEGRPSKEDEGSNLGAEVAAALRQWMSATKDRYPEAVWQLPKLISRIAFETPHEASESLRFGWQGLGRKPLRQLWPARLDRAVVVSPFIQPDFLQNLLDMTRELVVVSIPQSLDGLPDETIAALNARAAEQDMPVLYQVTDHGNPDDAYIDGIHAKLLLFEDAQQRSMTYVGSANATGPGWGLSGTSNVEAMVEMRPGISINRFMSGFIRESQSKLHPWVSEYDRSARMEPDAEQDMERQLLAALREVAGLELILRYDAHQQRMTISTASETFKLPAWISSGDITFSFAPFLLAHSPENWRPLKDITPGSTHFDGVPIDKVTAFISVRAQCTSPKMDRLRFVVARLEVDRETLNERDATLRSEIMAHADPAMVLNALIRGVSHVRTGEALMESGKRRVNGDLRALLEETTLERLLQAVALDRSLIRDMRLLLGPHHGEPLTRLCDDLEEVLQRVHDEVVE